MSDKDVAGLTRRATLVRVTRGVDDVSAAPLTDRSWDERRARAAWTGLLAFGEDAAATLGVAVGRTRVVLMSVTALLTAVLVSSVGAIGFVGLVLPHAARLLTGPGHARLLPVSALAGAVLLVWVDTVARTVLEPQEVPVGVVTALIGVPAFVLILYRSRGVR